MILLGNKDIFLNSQLHINDKNFIKVHKQFCSIFPLPQVLRLPSDLTYLSVFSFQKWCIRQPAEQIGNSTTGLVGCGANSSDMLIKIMVNSFPVISEAIRT